MGDTLTDYLQTQAAAEAAAQGYAKNVAYGTAYGTTTSSAYPPLSPSYLASPNSMQPLPAFSEPEIIVLKEFVARILNATTKIRPLSLDEAIDKAVKELATV
jgi:hypothetical protein